MNYAGPYIKVIQNSVCHCRGYTYEGVSDDSGSLLERFVSLTMLQVQGFRYWCRVFVGVFV